MITLSDKLIYAAYAFVVSILLYIISRIKWKNGYNERQDNRLMLRINVPLIISEIILIVFIVLFCAYRQIELGHGGTDAYGYKLRFLASTGSLQELFNDFRGWEPLYTLSLWIVRLFTDNYRIYLIIYYVIVALLLIKCAGLFEFKRRSYISIFALALFSLDSFNTQRNILAALIGFMIYDMLKRKKYKKALIMSIIAILIHFSAAIYLFCILGFWFLRYFKGRYEYKMSGYIVVSILVSGFASYFIPALVGGTRLSVYTSSMNVSAPMLLAFAVLMTYQFLKRKSYEKDETVMTLATMLITFSPMFVFQLYYSIMYRMMLFAIPMLYLLIAEYKKKLRPLNIFEDTFYYLIFDAILILRIAPFFTASFSDIGSYSNILIR